jgi:histidinol-phosphate phosphatase family protein
MTMSKINQAVILCGGLGTRLLPITRIIPKPMVIIHKKKPFLLYLLQQLSSEGISEFILLTGYLSNCIKNFFGNGENWGWKITYSDGPVNWDTGRRLWEAKKLLKTKFLLLYSDNYAQFELDKINNLHNKKQFNVTLLIKPKKNGNISVEGNKVKIYDNKRENSNLNFVELGYMIINRDVVLSEFYKIKNFPNISFSQILNNLAKSSMVGAVELHTDYYSISDIKRLEICKNFLKPKKILLLDRDGTIHDKAEKGTYIDKIEQVKFIKKNIDGLIDLSKNDFSFVVISNQAGIGRSMITYEAVNKINQYIYDYCLKLGINILKFYICPHHWVDKCFCRKPSPGLFYKCSDNFNLRLNKVLYIGDDIRDCFAAKNAGSRCLFVGNKKDTINTEFENRDNFLNIYEALTVIKNFYK